MYSVISVKKPISEIAIMREQSWIWQIGLCGLIGNPPRNSPWQIFLSKSSICVNLKNLGRASPAADRQLKKKMQDLVIYTREISANNLSKCVSKICKSYSILSLVRRERNIQTSNVIYLHFIPKNNIFSYNLVSWIYCLC